MTCNRAGCPDASEHVHLRVSDERAIADVLLERHLRRQAHREIAEARRGARVLARVEQGWRRCPDSMWRIPADWPPLQIERREIGQGQ
jgi:hypothetical protein